jgi:hypothetical protein
MKTGTNRHIGTVYLTRIPQLTFTLQISSWIDTTVLVANGMFDFRESVLVNLIVSVSVCFTFAYFRVSSWLYFSYNVIVINVFNLIDSRINFTMEVQSFRSVVSINKTSTSLSKFVDRLLPKHVRR